MMCDPAATARAFYSEGAVSSSRRPRAASACPDGQTCGPQSIRGMPGRKAGSKLLYSARSLKHSPARR